jgi:hypothetical protein
VKGIAEQTELDIIQLSGHEGWANLDFYHPYAVINAEHVAGVCVSCLTIAHLPSSPPDMWAHQ